MKLDERFENFLNNFFCLRKFLLDKNCTFLLFFVNPVHEVSDKELGLGQKNGGKMQPMSSKYTLWILVLLSVAVLQGIAISRDGFFADRPKAVLSATEDFSFLSPSNHKKIKNLIPVSMIASVNQPVAVSSSDKDPVISTERAEFLEIQSSLVKEMDGPVSDDANFEIDMTDFALEANNNPPKNLTEPLESQEPEGLSFGAEGYITHTVKRGETLSKVAKMYDMTVSQLVLYNGIMNPDHIYPGYQLQIAFSKTFEHIVKGQETLWSISRLYGVSVDKIRNLNNLVGNDLRKEQVLKIEVEDLSEVGLQRFIKARKRKSRFMWPLEGRLTDRYGWRMHPLTRKRNFHKGIDIAAPKGAKISAADDGKVVFAGQSGGYGNLVIVRHSSGYETRYAHCSTVNVKIGERVKGGDTVAEVGSTGVSTGYHLHFEIRKNGKIIDPHEYL